MAEEGFIIIYENTSKIEEKNIQNVKDAAAKKLISEDSLRDFYLNRIITKYEDSKKDIQAWKFILLNKIVV
jgi:hypothetical protein